MKSLHAGAQHQGVGGIHVLGWSYCKFYSYTPWHSNRTTKDTRETTGCLLGQGQTFGPSETGGSETRQLAGYVICQLLTAESDMLSPLPESPTFKGEKSSLVFPNQYSPQLHKTVSTASVTMQPCPRSPTVSTSSAASSEPPSAGFLQPPRLEQDRPQNPAEHFSHVPRPYEQCLVNSGCSHHF